MDEPYHEMIFWFMIATVISAVWCSSAPWYPKTIPIRTGGHHHHHTTHIVTHPVTRTRVLVLEDDDHHHNHLHKHGVDNDLHQRQVRKKTSSHRQEYRHSSARSRKIANDALHKINPNYKYYVPYEGDRGHHEDDDHSYHPPRYQKTPFASPKEPSQYSYPIGESPWKPVLQYPKGYLPLKHLGIDEARVVEVVKDAMAEIQRNEKNQIPLSSIGTRSYYKNNLDKKKPFHRGAVFYDDFAIVVKPYKADTRPRYRNAFNSRGHEGWKQDLKNTRLNNHCNC